VSWFFLVSRRPFLGNINQSDGFWLGGQDFLSWEMFAAVGQLAAVLIGIPSIIYLAVQIRAQTRERRLSAANALTVQWGDLTKAVHDSVEFSELHLRGVHSFSDLDGPSKLRFRAFQNRFFHNFEGMIAEIEQTAHFKTMNSGNWCKEFRRLIALGVNS
jgi:hypothetical protein